MSDADREFLETVLAAVGPLSRALTHLEQALQERLAADPPQRPTLRAVSGGRDGR